MDSRAEVTWNIYSPGYFENPYDHLKECRQNAPIQRIKGLKDSWIIFKYEDINEIISSKDHLVSDLSGFFAGKEKYIFNGTDACPYLSTGTKMWTMYLNGNQHKDARIIMGKSLKLSSLSQALADAVSTVNNKYRSLRHFDLVNYCGEFIFLVVKEILRLKDSAQYEEIKKYSNFLARSQDYNVPKQVYKQINDWLIWGKDIFTESEFKSQLVSHGKELDVNYTEDEVYSTAALTLMAAFETSKDNLSVALHEMIQNKGILDYAMDADKFQLNLLIEELFRFSSPLQYTIRINTFQLEYEDHIIPANNRLFLALASANRDETQFEKPNEIVVDRNPNDHMAFGKGLHFCLGANIARQELRLCLKPMLDFLKEYKVDDEIPVEWSKQTFMRTVKSCHVTRV